MLSKKKGFTIVELLAVIVVLSIIAVISVPLVLKYIKTSREQALLESARNIVHAVEMQYVDDEIGSENNMEDKIYTIENGIISPNLPISSKEIKGTGFVEVDVHKNIRIHLNGYDVCAKKQFADANVILVRKSCTEKPDTIVNLDKTGASIPQLDTSMVPIRWDNHNWVKADKDNTNESYQWYDYASGMWANMAVVKSNKKQKYLEAAMGTVIDEEDVLGYFVGIPTFTYSLSTGTKERAFDVEFTDEQTNAIKNHPAFAWGDETISGFWFSKFELSGSTEQIYALPNKPTLKNLSLTKMYQTVQALSDLKVKDEFNQKLSEIHLIKNTEWGAVTILSQSKYGVCKNGTCTKVSKNETWNTGYANAKSPYDSVNGMKASTTGNIYGIYDMNGGAWEFTMGTNKIDTLKTDIKETYYNSYNTKGIKGDLTTEDGTTGWYGSTGTFLENSKNWFIRGGDVNTPDSSLFWYKSDGPNGGFRNGFRIAYVIKSK